LFDGQSVQYFEGERIATKSLHGTGCTFASAIAAELAKGAAVIDAVRSAKAFITQAIRLAEPIGHGFGPTHHLGALYTQAARYDTLLQLEAAVARLQEGRIAALIPDGRSNLGMALPHAATPQEVAAWVGQIVRAGVDVCPMGGIRFGSSQPIVAVILTVMRSDPTYRSAMAIRYDQDVLHACQSSNLRIAQFTRQEAPSEVRQDESLTLAWGVARAIQRAGAVPDIIYDLGDMNQASMVQVLGRDASDVASKVLLIRHHFSPQ
jgi:hydroxymethylpyrimidine/phosphomethylpyrimidine kinase